MTLLTSALGQDAWAMSSNREWGAEDLIGDEIFDDELFADETEEEVAGEEAGGVEEGESYEEGSLSEDALSAEDIESDDDHIEGYSFVLDEEWDAQWGEGDSEYTLLSALQNDPTYRYYESQNIDGTGLRYVTQLYMGTQERSDEEEWMDDVITVDTGSKEVRDFIEYIGPMCMGDAALSGILASVSIAQAILESGFGRSGLAKKANNLFGIKAGSAKTSWSEYSTWDGSYVQMRTKEQLDSGEYITITARFRAYPSIQASIADHSAYLAHATKGKYLRYGGLVGCTDYRKCFQIIKAGGYATSHDYVEKLCKIVEKYDLTKFD